MSTKTKEVAVIEPTGSALALMSDFEADCGGGFEEATATAYAIPFLKLLAAMSKQCKKGTPEFIPGASEGEFFNTVTQEIFSGEEGLYIIPVHFIPKFIEYEGTVDEGGGFVRSHNVAEGTRLLATTSRDEDGNERLPRGDDGKQHILVDVREHYLLMLRPGTQEAIPVILGLSSSGIPVSKQWMSLMGQLKRKPTQNTPDPMFSHVYHLTSFMKQSKKVSTMFATYKIAHSYPIENAPWSEDVISALYNQAKAFKAQISSGAIQEPVYDEDRTSFDTEKY